MLTNLSIVLPIFALILAGWIARKTGALSENATREVNRLVVYLALPALLFDIMANAKPAEIWQPGFILAFTAGCAVIFCATLCWRIAKGRHLADAAIDGLNASYANTGFIGFPLVLSLIGDTGMAPVLISTILTVCVLFAVAIILIEGGLQSETRRRDIVVKTARSLAKNPLLVAPALGALVMFSGVTLPAPVHAFLKLLGGAASPCALIALGLFLAGAKVIPIKQRIAYEAAEVVIATGHKDPGDCYLIATARVKKIPIITRDTIIQGLAAPDYLDVIVC